MRTIIVVSVALALSQVLTGCSNPGVQSSAELNRVYENALLRTAETAARFEPGSNAEAQLLERLQSYFISMSAESVSRQTAAVYAEDAVLYDNVVALQGLDTVQAYFARAAADVDELHVEFLHVARADADFYIRWKMTIVSDRLASGEPLVSYGITQFRFDDDGRVLLHRDFWDASTGLYEYLPVVGGLIERIRGLLAGHSDAV